MNIKLNVYKLKDSSLGLYHTGVEFGDLEYTYCHGMGIAYHRWFSVRICMYKPGQTFRRLKATGMFHELFG